MKIVTGRIIARCTRVGECLVWQGHVANSGYGTTTIKGKTVFVHRAIFAERYGPIQSGKNIDHVKSRGCRFRTCCNIDHLEAVTPRVNVLRGDTIVAANVGKTHCPRGHVLRAGNIQTFPSSLGRRRCKTCGRERLRNRSNLRRATARWTEA